MTAILSIFLQVRYRRGAGLRRAGGFTFVEVVMVLVLLGILAAVAVPKYFDIQAQAAATKCAYHRSLVIKTLHQRWAFTKIDESFRSVFPNPDEAGTSVLHELGGDNCSEGKACLKLCPTGGSYEVRYEGDDDAGYQFSVECTEHGLTGSDGLGDNTEPDRIRVKSDNADLLAKWLVGKDRETAGYEQKIGNGAIASIDGFFTESSVGIIDSEAVGDFTNNRHQYGTDETTQEKIGSMTELVNKALAAAGFDTSAVIWRMERDAGGLATDPVTGKRTWRNRLTFTLAEKPSSYPEGSAQVTTKVYEFDIWYTEAVKGRPVRGYGDIESRDGKATLEKSTNGRFYVLTPGA